jgi:hypothetical protein
VREILVEEQPYDFLHAQDVLPIIHTRFQGIEPAPIHIKDNFYEKVYACGREEIHDAVMMPGERSYGTHNEQNVYMQCRFSGYCGLLPATGG